MESESLSHQDLIAACDLAGHSTLQLDDAVLVDELEPVVVDIPKPE